MAKPKTLSFGAFLILIGDGGTPETFTAPCAFTEKSLTISTETTDLDVPDCDDPDAASWIERVATSKGAEVTGSGVLALADLDDWRGFIGTTKTIRVQFDATLADNGGYYEGPAILSSFGVTAARRDKVQVSVTLVSAGDWSWTDAAA